MSRDKPASPAKQYSSVRAAAAMAVLFVFIVATRWPLAPKYLYYFDSANFALSLEKFDPSMHQPQPPGYPLFVLLIRIIHFWIQSPERVLLVAGLVAAGAATLLIRALAAELADRTAGIFAAALLVSDPVFWFAGITNQIRLFLAVAALAVALLAWRAMKQGGRWFYASFAALGIAAGFRPELAVLLVPLLLLMWRRTGGGPGRLAAGAGVLLACMLPWLAVIAHSVGGPGRLILLSWDYATVQFGSTSLVFGAAAAPAGHMFWDAVVWNLLGALACVWAIPLVRWRPITPERREKAVFLAFAFLPPFLFSAFIHVGDPDQALASISILATACGILLAAMVRQTGRRRVLLISAVLVSVHALIFFKPPGKVARAASYKAVAAVDHMTTDAITAIREVRGDGPVTIVHYGSLVSSRQLSYYFPDDYVVVLTPGAVTAPAPGLVEAYYRHAPLVTASGPTAPIRPGSRRVLCLPGGNVDADDVPGWRRFGPVYYVETDGNSPMRVGPYRLILLK